MLLTSTTKLLDEITEQSRILRADILAHVHERDKSKPAYYLSPNGNDENDGLSPSTAWKTLKRLSGLTLEPGTEVLFECGGIWRGKMSAKSGVTYSSYGSGQKPRIYGSPLDGAKDGHWSELAPNIWRYSRKLTEDVGCIVFDGGDAHAIKLLQDFSHGEPVEMVSRQPFSGWEDLTEDLTFFHDLGREQTLNEDGGYVYLCSKSGDPAKRFNEIEFNVRHNIVWISGDGVTIDNLCIMYGGCHGIGSHTVKDLTVKYCELGWIGGSLQFYKNGRPTRYGNGVEIYGGCENYSIDHCLVYQVYDAGITHQYSAVGTNNIIMNNVRYTSNLIEHCTYSIEYFLGKPENDSVTRYMSNIRMSGNILLNAGFGWGDQRPDKIEAAHIKSWDHMNTAEDFVIENNVLVCSRYMMLHIGAVDASYLPTLKGNCFVQYGGRQFARLGVNPTLLSNYEISNPMIDNLGGNEFYCISDT